MANNQQNQGGFSLSNLMVRIMILIFMTYAAAVAADRFFMPNAPASIIEKAAVFHDYALSILQKTAADADVKQWR